MPETAKIASLKTSNQTKVRSKSLPKTQESRAIHSYMFTAITARYLEAQVDNIMINKLYEMVHRSFNNLLLARSLARAPSCFMTQIACPNKLQRSKLATKTTFTVELHPSPIPHFYKAYSYGIINVNPRDYISCHFLLLFNFCSFHYQQNTE